MDRTMGSAHEEGSSAFAGSVLVVDDEVSITGFLGSALPEAGFPCRTAPTAEAALEILAGERFDIVLVDVVLPGMDGFELTRRVRQEHPHAAIIVMTGHAGRFPHDVVLEAGADDLIAKPFTFRELLARFSLAATRRDPRRCGGGDRLTGAYNRRGFLTLAHHVLQGAKRTGEELHLLYFDLDGLGTINDTHGRQEGDRALLDTVGILRDTFPEPDLLGRVGDDEFAVLRVATSRISQEILLRRLEEAVARHNAAKTRRFALSVSSGISAVSHRDSVPLEGLLEDAGRDLRRRKQGRLAPPPAGAAPKP